MDTNLIQRNRNTGLDRAMMAVVVRDSSRILLSFYTGCRVLDLLSLSSRECYKEVRHMRTYKVYGQPFKAHSANCADGFKTDRRYGTIYPSFNVGRRE